MNNSDFTPEKLEQARLLADTPMGQQLKALLRQSNAQGLRQAMDQAAQGDLDAARKSIEAFMTTPEAAELMGQLRKNP